LSSKSPKQLTQAFNCIYQGELKNIKEQGKNTKLSLFLTKSIGQIEYREKFFNDTLMASLAAKQYKRRKNAFYILAYLVQTDPHFVGVALK
jgi:hypothetical protein